LNTGSSTWLQCKRKADTSKVWPFCTSQGAVARIKDCESDILDHLLLQSQQPSLILPEVNIYEASAASSTMILLQKPAVKRWTSVMSHLPSAGGCSRTPRGSAHALPCRITILISGYSYWHLSSVLRGCDRGISPHMHPISCLLQHPISYIICCVKIC
jgi:hypothetical protein